MALDVRGNTSRTLRRMGLILGAVTVSTTVLAACSSPTAPSVTAGPTVQAAATNAAPTVQALATLAAPTVQALGTQTAPIVATVTAAAPVRVTDARASSNDATVMLQNTGDQPVDLSGWSLLIGTARAQLPPGLSLQPAKSVTVHTTSGTNSGSDVYLGQDAQTLVSQLHPGVTIALDNASGGTVSSFVVPNG